MKYKIKDIKDKILCGDVISELKKIPDESIDTVITSPPYFGLRSYDSLYDKEFVTKGEAKKWILQEKEKNKDYFSKIRKLQDVDGKIVGYKAIIYSKFIKKNQVGLEETPQDYINRMVKIAHEIKRVLKKTGSFWLNIADSFWTKSGSGTIYGNLPNQQEDEYGVSKHRQIKRGTGKYPTKCLLQIPQRLAIALTDKVGFTLRNDVIWGKQVLIHKTNSTIGNVMPTCLDKNTEIYLKNKKTKKISISTLGELIELKFNNYDILSPTGWKQIKNVWKVKKDKTITFQVGSSTQIISSLEHRFPISHDNRRKRYEIKNAKDLRMGMNKMLDRFLFVPIGKFLDDKINKIKLSDIVPKDKFYINEGKELKTKINKSLTIIASDLGFKIKKHKSGYSSKLQGIYISSKRLPIECIDFYNIKDNYFISLKKKKAGSMPNEWMLDYDFGKFLGLYATEGGFNSSHNNSYQCKFTFHKKEIDLISFVVEFLKQKTNLIKINIPTKNNCTDVVFSSAPLFYLVKHIVMGKCNTKSLNMNLILNTSFQFRKGLFDGIIAGDGFVSKDNRISFASASKQLRDDVYLLASSIGLLASKYRAYERYDKRTKKIYTSYYLSIPTSLQKEYKKREAMWAHATGKNEFKAKTLKFSNPQIINKSKELIDIEVDDGLFLINGGIVSHNSVKDRFNNSYEHLFFFTKNKKYHFNLDSVRIPHQTQSLERYQRAVNLGAIQTQGKIFEDKVDKPMQPPKVFREKFEKDKNYQGKFDGYGIESENYGSPRARNERIPREGLVPGNTSQARPEHDVRDLGRSGRGGNNPELNNRNFMPTKKANKRADETTMFFQEQKKQGGNTNLPWKPHRSKTQDEYYKIGMRNAPEPNEPNAFNVRGKNLCDIWQINTQPSPLKHFALFPKALLMRPIKTCLPKNGIVLDPFIGCYDRKTEILTSNGFKFFKSLTMNDRVATMENGFLKYRKPLKIFKYTFNGKMLHFKARHVDLVTTLEHNMYVKKRFKNCLEFVSAKDLKTRDKFYHHTKWNGIKRKYFVLPEYKYIKDRWGTIGTKTPLKIEMNIWLSFLGIWMSDGCVPSKRITQITNITCSIEIEKVLNKMPFNWKKYGKDYRIYSVQLSNYLSRFGKCQSKYIPMELKILDKKYLKVLFDNLIMCDGYIPYPKIFHYYTTSLQLANDVYEIGIKLGYTVCMTKRPPRIGGIVNNKQIYGRLPCYAIYFTTRNQSRFSGLRHNPKTINYNGNIYCCEVPSHIIFVRRNGKSCWCGNSGTTAIAQRLHCPSGSFIGIEINPEYVKLAQKRIKEESPEQLGI